MDFHHSNHKEINNTTSAAKNKNSINLGRCYSIKNENENKNLNTNHNSLFKEIVTIQRTQTKKTNKAPLVKYNSVSNNNILNFVNVLYNNEEHLNKNQIHPFKYSENSEHQDEILSPAKTLHHEYSITGSCEKFGSSRLILNLSKEKQNNTLKKRLSKKYSYNNFSSFSPKRKSKKNSNSGFSKKYSYFFKLKEKEKIPSKTPYLDTKFWNSSFHLDKYHFNENTGNISPNKKISNKSLFSKFQSPKHLKKVINRNSKRSEKNIIKKNNNLEQISSSNNIKNDNINSNKTENDKETVKEIKKNPDKNNIENKSSLQNNTEKKQSKNIIVHILQKPFFCCLKSN